MQQIAAAFTLTLAVLFGAVPAMAQQDHFRVTLLGTGDPDPYPNRFGASILVEVAGMRLLFDTGRGSTIRLYQLHIPLSPIDMIFFTHYYSDHTSGLSDLLLTGWLYPPDAGHRSDPLNVTGPIGAKNLLSNIEKAYAADIGVREQLQHLPPRGVTANIKEFNEDGVVFDKSGVRVTAFKLNGPQPDYGYRIDFDGRSAVLAVDNAVSESVVQHAQRADLLIHEVALVSSNLTKDPAMSIISSIHTLPDQAGSIFTRSNPKLAVYTHVVTLGNPRPTVEDIIGETRKSYAGPLVIGEDLMSFDISYAGVAVYFKTTCSLCGH